MCSDVIALMGDAADGIPGAVGIGVKTAAKMMLQFGGLESMLKRVGEVRGKKTQQARSPTPHARPPSIAWTWFEYTEIWQQSLFFWSFFATV
jgi:hypothetical protein